MKVVSKSILPDYYKQKRLTLVEVAIVLVILDLLIGLGASLIGPLTKRAKINETKERLNGNVKSIISWAAGNKRLSNTMEFTSVIRNSNDLWGKQFYSIMNYYSHHLAQNIGFVIEGQQK